MNRPLHVLHIARWYPWKGEAMLGLFLQRQVEALPNNVRSTVLFVWPDAGVKSVQKDVFQTREGHTEIRIIYPKAGTSLSNAVIWWRLAMDEARKLVDAGDVDVVHAHMFTRTVMVARSLNRTYGLPFVVSEHWSRYFPQASGYRHPLKLWMARRVLRRASALICVSQALQEAMEPYGLSHPRTYIVPNVVDTNLFNLAENADKKEQDNCLRLIHLSCFDDKAKNISGLLRGFASAKWAEGAVQLELYGDGPDREAMMQLATSLRIKEFVRFPGEIDPQKVAQALRQSDFLIQTSHYETFSVAIVEAWSCGVPVVSTRVGVFGQYANERLGVVIPDSTPEAIAATLAKLPALKGTFGPSTLRNFALKRFSNAHVGSMLAGIYKEVADR